MVFKGYWGHPEATKDAFVRSTARPSSAPATSAGMDEEGYFFITDRLKRMINASGFKVWPSEVELLLFKCPLVLEACVIAARDAYRGETVKAVIVLRPEAARDIVTAATEQDIIDWAREHMAAYKAPRRGAVRRHAPLPRSGSGKVMWRRQMQEGCRPARSPPRWDSSRVRSRKPRCRGCWVASTHVTGDGRPPFVKHSLS
jgi:fatty-acyl-CoA synthase